MSSPYSSRPAPQGTLRIFRALGIDVYVHWSWAIVAVIVFHNRWNDYDSPIWNVAEYLSLFAIVLLHEFGHALACRSVGGQADTIMLWPLGGIAFVNPPHRPGAWLWSIAAGPLVNVALLPITIGLYWYFHVPHRGPQHDFEQYLFALAFINAGLLIFNMLPIYPLDGGQIAMSILWYFMRFERALMIAAYIGMAGAAVGLAFALKERDPWLVAIAIFAAWRCWRGIQLAQAIQDMRRINEPTYQRRGL